MHFLQILLFCAQFRRKKMKQHTSNFRAKLTFLL